MLAYTHIHISCQCDCNQIYSSKWFFARKNFGAAKNFCNFYLLFGEMLWSFIFKAVLLLLMLLFGCPSFCHCHRQTLLIAVCVCVCGYIYSHSVGSKSSMKHLPNVHGISKMYKVWKYIAKKYNKLTVFALQV